MKNKVAILIGSVTDQPIIENSFEYYDYFGIDYELHVMSAHRNPDDVAKFSKDAKSNGYSILIGSA